jgi:SpoVK/Ycf46/Vps4 family AAA+-type ATPase
MTLWDGLTSTNASGVPARIVVLGATNRINDIDEAILRRMPKKFPVPLPGKEQRRRILQLILKDAKTDPDHFDMEYVAKVTAGMSGSDIKEACRDAAMVPMREYIREHRASGAAMNTVNPDRIRGIRNEDFFGRKVAAKLPAQYAQRQSAAAKSRRKSEDDGFEDVPEGPIAESLD